MSTTNTSHEEDGEISGLNDTQISDLNDTQMEEGEASADEFDTLEDLKRKENTTEKLNRKVDKSPDNFGSLSNEEDETNKFTARAKRFGTGSNSNSNSVPEPKFLKLYKSLGLQKNDFYRDGWREEAIHLSGVKGLDIEDLKVYFQDHGPDRAEWLSSNTCNIIWKSRNGAANALLKLSCPIKSLTKEAKKISSNKKKLPQATKKEDNSEASSSSDSSSDGSTSSSSDSDSSSSTDSTSSDEAIKKPVKSKTKTTKQNSTLALDDEQCVYREDVECQIPPGQWRLGVPHDNACVFLMRFANCMDRNEGGFRKKTDFFAGNLKPDIRSRLQKRVERPSSRLTTRHPAEDAFDMDYDMPQRPQVKNYQDLDEPSGDRSNPWGSLAENWHKKPDQSGTDYQSLLRKHVIFKSEPKRRLRDMEDDFEEERPSKMARYRPAYKEVYKDDQDDYETASESDGSDGVVTWKSKSKVPRMKMYADDEQKKRKVIKPRRSLKGRVGAKYGSDHRFNSKTRQPGFDLRDKLSNRRS